MTDETTDIVKFLRSSAAAEEEQFPILNDGYETANLLTTAADEIERLRAELESVREQLWEADRDYE